MGLIVSAIGQGLLWAILGLGLFLTFRILDIADMTVEGTFPLGAAVGVTAIVNGMSPIVATLLAMLAGMAAGLITGLLYTKRPDSNFTRRNLSHDRCLFGQLTDHG